MARKKEKKAKKGKKKDKKMRTVTVVFPSLVLPIPGLPIIFPSPKKKKKKGKKKRGKKKAVKKRGMRVKIDPLPSVFEEEEPKLREVILHPDLLADIGGVYCLQLSSEVQSMMECVIGKDVVIDHHWKYIPRETIAEHIKNFGEDSPFYPLQFQIQTSKTPHVLCVYDKNLIADYLFVCVEPFPEFKMYKYTYKVKRNWSQNTRGILQRELYHYKSKTAAKIRFLIRRHTKIRTRRDKIMISIVMDKKERDERQRVLTSVESDELNDGYKFFEPSPQLRSRVLQKYDEKLRTKSHNQQVVPVVKHQLVQTEESVRYNKAVQKDYLFMDKIDNRTTRRVVNVLTSGFECLSQSLKEFATIDVYHNLADKYKNLYIKRLSKEALKSGKTLFVSPSVSLDKWTYIRQTIKRIPNMGFYKEISCVSWHPRYLDLFAIAYQGNCGPSNEIDECLVSQILEEVYRPEYVIVLWKIGLDMKPLRIIESYSEIKALQYNADYPSLLAGANKSGQILLWDMNIPYIPEHPFLRKMSEEFGDALVPWNYIPHDTTHAIIESSEVFSHAGVIYDLQWLPSNSKILNDGTTEISENIRSGQIVTASEDGTVGLWSFQSPHPVLRTLRKRGPRLSKVAPDVSGFMQYDRHMKPDVKYVVAWRGGEAVPVRSVSVNNVRQILVPGRIRSNYFSYKSMKNGSERIRPMMHSNIMAGLSNGEVFNINPRHKAELNFSEAKVENFVKDRNWENIVDAKVDSFYFRHESAVVCLRRCHFADDMILSVSMASFCVWKEQSKIAKTRKKHMPWLQSWYSETVHEVAPSVMTVPVVWKRNFDPDVEYLTGEWSTHRAAMVYLIRKDGYVEIWDLREQDKQPFMIIKVGQKTIHHSYPLVFSMEEDQMAFIEDFFMYIIKLPDVWKSTDFQGNKYLQRTGSHEAWRRTLYTSWNTEYVGFHRQEIENEIREIFKVYERRRLERIKRDFLRLKYRKAQMLKEKEKCITWIDKYPFRWWQKEKEIHYDYYLKKKGMPIKWTVIDKRNSLLAYLKTYTDHTLPNREMKLDNFIYFDWETKAVFREHFQLYWDIRYHQVHKYKYLYVEEDEQDRGIVEEAVLLHLEERDTTVERKSEYGLCYKFQDSYSAKRLNDIYKKNIAVFQYFAEIQSRLKSRTKFYLENDHLYRTSYLNKLSERVHQTREGWKPYVNKTLELWSLYNLLSGPQPIRRVPKTQLYSDDVTLILLRWGF